MAKSRKLVGIPFVPMEHGIAWFPGCIRSLPSMCRMYWSRSCRSDRRITTHRLLGVLVGGSWRNPSCWETAGDVFGLEVRSDHRFFRISGLVITPIYPPTVLRDVFGLEVRSDQRFFRISGLDIPWYNPNIPHVWLIGYNSFTHHFSNFQRDIQVRKSYV